MNKTTEGLGSDVTSKHKESLGDISFWNFLLEVISASFYAFRNTMCCDVLLLS